MKFGRKIVFWVAISIITVFLTAPILMGIANLEFTSEVFKAQYVKIRVIVLPLAILLTLIGASKENLSRRIVWTVVGAFSVFVVCLGIFFNFCSWTDERNLFINSTNPAVKIILREYGCGATDSGLPQTDILKTYSTGFLSEFVLLTR